MMIRLSNTTPIRDLRIALKMSQKTFAAAIGVDQTNVSAMERRLPTLRTLARVLAKLGLEPALWATPGVPPAAEVMVHCGHQAGKATKIRALANEVQALEVREVELQGRLAKLRAAR